MPTNYEPFFLLAFALQGLICNAQGSELRAIISKIFYEPHVYGKLFYVQEKGGEVGAYIYGDTVIQKEIPTLYHDLIYNGYKLKYIENRLGNVYIFGEVLFIHKVDLFVIHDKINISSDEAQIAFHTSSVYSTKRMKNRYVSVTCSLKKNKGEWEITSLKIRKSRCCDKIWGDL